MSRIAEHVWADGKCVHCGLLSHESAKSCVFRDGPPRPVPESIFAKPWEIGERLKELQTEREAAQPKPEAALELADLG